jgi:DNA mismatch repair protein MutH
MLPYNLNDKESIIEFAKLLIGKSVQSEFANEIALLKINAKDKGRLGKVIEELYFGYKPNSNPQADFKEAGLELKAAGLKKLAKNKGLNAKERLVLSKINYSEAVNKDFEKDFLTGKNAHLLLVFYLYEKGINILESIIKLVGDWKYSDVDIEIIRKDFEFIKQKISEGKAHELSEGQTNYLGACTKAKDSKVLVKQPNSNILAKPRAYSLKPGYVNHIIASIANPTNENYGKLISSISVAKKQTLEEIVLAKFKPLIGKSDGELIELLDVYHINPASKDYYSKLSNAIVKSIFEVPKKRNIEEFIQEFEKAEILVKTVRLKESNLPAEDISFPCFEYLELVEEEWENADFKHILSRKFLFVFFQFENNKLILRKVKFWNMPNSDVEEAKKVWVKTIEIVNNGDIVKSVKIDKKGKKIRSTNFPGKKFNKISHVRPHASTSSDTYPLPVIDKLTQEMKYTKHCFWLNASYVRDEIYLK